MSQYDSPPNSGGSDPRPVTGLVTTQSPGAGTSHDTEPPPSTPEVATDQAKQVGHEALDSGRQVAQVAKDEASSVVGEAGAQAKNLLGEARTQLTDQAATQQNNLAAWLSSIVDELNGMVDRSEGGDTQSGAATALVRQVSTRARSAATWLENHEPADLLTETSRFARQRPGLFLALAAVGGLVAGRLTRGLAADASASQSPASPAAIGADDPTPIYTRSMETATTTNSSVAEPFQADVLTTVPGARTESEPAWDVR